MRRDEEFVGRALVEFFGGPSRASVSDGEDPPDLYLTVDTSRVGVEVTQLSQVTFERDGTLGNRTTQDFFGLRLLDELNTKIGPSLPADVSLMIGLRVPVPNAARFRKGLTEWVTKVASAPEKGLEQEQEIARHRREPARSHAPSCGLEAPRSQGVLLSAKRCSQNSFVGPVMAARQSSRPRPPAGIGRIVVAP